MNPQSSLSRCVSREERGGYDCQLVHPPPSHIQTECSVCLQILRDPCIVSCCGHKFCRVCIEAVTEMGKDCPLCNGHNFSFMSEHSLSRTLLDLDVFCSAQPDGCTWTGKLKDVQRHLNRAYTLEDQLNGCQFIDVTCVHPGCGGIMHRRHAEAHQTGECGKRPHTCQHCQSYTSTHEEVTETHYYVCDKFPVQCPNGCSVFPIQRCRMEEHLRNNCSLVTIVCPFLYAGCEVSLPRKEMQKHTLDVTTHFPMLADVTQRLVCENTELQFRVAKLERDKEERERFVMTRIFQLSSACCASHHFIRHTELRRQNEGGPFVVDTTIGSFVMNAAINSDTVSKTFEMEMRSMYFAVLPYEFKMDNFLNYIKGGPIEYSPIFYTHSFGYRFRVKVMRTEYSKLLSLEAFTSVYVEILAGPFDDRLNWPFKGSITIAVVNQLGDCNHYAASVCFCNETYESKTRTRPEKGSPVSVGLRPFIYHKDLRTRHSKDGLQTHYLPNGSLHFRVTKIELSKNEFENSLC